MKASIGLVLFTLILPVLLGVMALGADLSVIYFNWAMVKRAVKICEPCSEAEIPAKYVLA